MRLSVFSVLCLLAASTPAVATPLFVNGLALDGGAIDLSGGTTANTGRLGYFSDLYYDPLAQDWWALSDRGPGGGALDYDTRVQRFTLDVDLATGAISNFKVVETIIFNDSGATLTGKSPSPASVLGRSFDPEGFVVDPLTGHLFVADEYGPSLYEFDRNGNLVRKFDTPANLVPKDGGTTDYLATPPTLDTGREPNRGFEALAKDGQYLYAVLQNGTVADGWTSSDRGQYTRIVKFDMVTGQAVAQYAYKLESAGQGRGVSALVALGNEEFLILERNNRGIGVGATLANPDKNVYRINLAGASDVTGITLPSTGSLPVGYAPVVKGPKVVDLDANTLAALGNKSPEKWEGLAIGPQLNDGSYLLLAGTDNDYSVTQNSSGDQFDVYFRFTDANPYASSIQCPLDRTVGCFFTTGGASEPPGAGYGLLPGVLHAYKAPAADVTPVPEPMSLLLVLTGMGGALAARRRAR